MSAIKKLLVGTAGIAAVIAAASPAAAQYYPGYGYGYQNNSPGAVVGQVINGVIAATQYGGYQYGNYGYGQSYGYRGQNIQANVAVSQCTGAVEARLNGGGYNNRYGGYNNYGAGAGGRVSGITDIQPRHNGALRVHGVISTMAGYGGGYGYQGGYGNQGYGAPNLSFTCKVDYSGRVIALGIEPYRPTYGYNRGW